MSEELKPMAPVGTFTKVDGTVVPYEHDYVIHWFSTEVYNRIVNLPPEEKERYFEMITEYGDLMTKILNDPNHVILEFAVNNNPWFNLEKHAAASNAAINYDLPTQLIEEYTLWKLKKDGLI